MSTPQLENGYTQIANELLEAILRFGFSQRELLVLFTLVRKVYGYQKKEDDISASQIGSMCNIARQHVTTTLKGLAARNVVTSQRGQYGMVVGIQKDHRKWITAAQLKTGFPGMPEQAGSGSPESGLVPKQDTSQNGTGDSPESGQVDSPESGHTKETLPKDNLKRKLPPTPPTGGRAQSKGKSEPTVLQTFLDDCKQKGERPMLNYQPLWQYTEGVGLPQDFVALAWVEFCRRFRPGGTGDAKRYKDWRKTFRKYVEGNYLKLWAIDGGDQYFLTTIGKQAQRIHESKGQHEQRDQSTTA